MALRFHSWIQFKSRAIREASLCDLRAEVGLQEGQWVGRGRVEVLRVSVQLTGVGSDRKIDLMD